MSNVAPEHLLAFGTVKHLHSDQEVAEAVGEAKQEVLEDISAGIIPSAVKDFGTLHDFVDANEYAGFTDPKRRADWPLDDLIKTQAAVDEWLAAGRNV